MIPIFSVFLWLLAAAGSGIAGGSEATGTLISHHAVAFNSNSGKSYVLDAPQGKLWILDTARRSSKSVEVGMRPAGVAVNAKTGLVYVTLSGEGHLAVLDGKTDTVVARLEVGPHPYALSIDENSNCIYVTNTFSDIVAVVHGSTNSIDRLHLGSSDDVAVDPGTQKVFLISYEDPDLKILDERSGGLQKVEVGEHLWGMAVSSQTGTVYLTNLGASELIAVDERTHAKRLAKVGSFPCTVALDESAKRAFVVNYGDNSLTVFDTSSFHRVAEPSVGLRPQSIFVNSRDHEVFVAGLQSGTLTRIDGVTGRVNGTFSAGSSPYAVGAGSESSSLVVADLVDAPWSIVRMRQIR